jgi:hypothetical protein
MDMLNKYRWEGVDLVYVASICVQADERISDFCRGPVNTSNSLVKNFKGFIR